MANFLFQKGRCVNVFKRRGSEKKYVLHNRENIVNSEERAIMYLRKYENMHQNIITVE